jgi:hypothetical protein
VAQDFQLKRLRMQGLLVLDEFPAVPCSLRDSSQVLEIYWRRSTEVEGWEVQGGGLALRITV